MANDPTLHGPCDACGQRPCVCSAFKHPGADLQEATNGALGAFGAAYIEWARTAPWQRQVRNLRRRPAK